MEDDTGNPAVADEKKELLIKAYGYVSSDNPDAGIDWYVKLQPYQLQMLSSGVGDVLYACAHIINALRGAVAEKTPRTREALNILEPLISILVTIKEK